MTHPGRRFLRAITVLALIPLLAVAQRSPESSSTPIPDSISLFEGQLTLVNVVKQQLLALETIRDTARSAQTATLVQRTYAPYRSFWMDYVGDSSAYIENVIPVLLSVGTHRLRDIYTAFAQRRLDTLFMFVARRLKEQSGHTPAGVWYLAFGHGVTDMGGFGNGRMVLDLMHPANTVEHVARILPHELNHQVYDRTATEDTTARGLSRCINEGFAVYVHSLLDKKREPLARYLFYSDEEMDFCGKNRDVILSKLRPFLLTSDPDHARALADRSQRIFKGGPGAIGYYVGYVIVEAYVQRHGPQSWRDIYTLPVRTVLEQSGL